MPSIAARDWSTTALWRILTESKQPDVAPVRTTLEVCLPTVQTILHSGISSKDFTLHDENHSFRVAERMVEIIPADVVPHIAARELGLLLLAAYLHDIGMTPEQRRVDRHYTYLLTNERVLSDGEREAFRRWLDEDGRAKDFPLDSGPPTVKHLLLARELVSYYCRFRHNDWSADYIRETLPATQPGLYKGWVDDLVVLCRSHHEGIEELRQSRFDPRDVGSPATTIHLRYLACILRLADVMEVDPERTPEVLIRARDIADASLLYWHKDQELTVRITPGRRVLLTARPTAAYLQRAIEETALQIEEELRTCRTLADSNFHRHPLLLEPLPHGWDLPASLITDIRPLSDAQDGGYEYINGAIRPDLGRLLEILSGTELYGSPLAAVGELVQNAFDAVRVQMAHERLRAPDPLDVNLVKHLESIHDVELRLEMRSDGGWLVCCDSGVGMAKSDIENRLLVSGKLAGADVRSLERHCREAGFRLNRIGQFGIGFLSYFMISDQVVMQTRRSPEGADTDGTGWRFSTGGVGQFGELRQDHDVVRGTKVSLRLDDSLTPDSSTLAKLIHDYLFRSILRCPCRFRFVAMTHSF